jgi:hypothetical protein
MTKTKPATRKKLRLIRFVLSICGVKVINRKKAHALSKVSADFGEATSTKQIGNIGICLSLFPIFPFLDGSGKTLYSQWSDVVSSGHGWTPKDTVSRRCSRRVQDKTVTFLKFQFFFA